MKIDTLAGKKVQESRVRTTLLAVLAGAVIGVPSTVRAQQLIEGDMWVDLGVDIASRSKTSSLDARWPRWTLNANGAGLPRTILLPGRTDRHQFGNPERSSIDAHWASAATGTWSNPIRWTTDPFYPHNGNPAGTTYNAFLDAIGPNHTVILDTDVDLDSFVINSSTVEFVHGGSNRLSATNSIDLMSGVYRLNSGVLADSTLNLLGGEFLIHGSIENIFRNMTVNGDFALNRVQGFGGFLRVQDGLTLNGTLSMEDTTNQLVFENTQTLHSGTIRLNKTQYEPSQINVVGGQTLTIGAAAAIRGGDAEMGERGFSQGTPGTNAIVNNGVISADLPGQSIGIYTSNKQQAGDSFYNNGTIEAIGGGELFIKHFSGDVNTARVDGAGSKLSLDGNYTINTPIDVTNASELTLEGTWANIAGINLTGNSLLRLGGSTSASSLGPLNTAGGNVHLLGDFSNVGSTIVMDGNWKLAGGSITGGSVSKSGAPLETVPGTQSTLSQLAYTGDLHIPSSTLIVEDVSIAGNTTVDSGVLDLRGAWSTSGNVTANQSTLRLGGTFDYGSFGSFARTNSPVELTGALDLLGNTLSLDPAQGTFTLGSGSVSNGTIDASLGTPLSMLRNKTAVLTDIRLLGEFSFDDASAITHNLINEGTIRIGEGTRLELHGNWSNPGLIDLWPGSSASTLVLGGTFHHTDLSNIVIMNDTVEIQGSLDNAGNTLVVGDSGSHWLLDGGTISGGTIDVLNPDAFRAFGPNSNPRYLTNRLDAVNITASFPAEYLTLSNGFGINGTLSMAGDNASLIFDGTQSFSQGTIDAPFRPDSTHNIYIEPDSTLTLDPTTTIQASGTIIGHTTTGLGTNSLTNNGIIRTDVTDESLTLATTALTNNGTLEATNGAIMTIDSQLTNTGTLRTATGATMHVNNALGSIGNIDLSGVGSTLNLDGLYSIDNTLTVNPGTSLTLNGDWSNNGLIQMTDGEINLGGYFSASGASGFLRTGGDVNLIGTFDNTSSVFELNATTGPWALKGGTFLGGTLALREGVVLESTGTSTGTLDNVIVDGDVLLTSGTLVSKNGSQFTGTARFTGGELQLVGDHAFDNGNFEFAGTGGWLHTVDPQNPTTLTFGPNFIAQGYGGLIGSGPTGSDDDTLINQGLLLGDRPGGPLTIAPKTFVNEGVVRASLGGSVLLDLTRSASPWTNAGTLEVQAGGILRLAGDFTTPGLGTLNRTGGEVITSGNFDNTGNTITISNVLGGWGLAGGTLHGGVVESLDNRRFGLYPGAQPNRFTGGVTINGDLYVASELFVSDGATFNGDVEIAEGTLNFDGDQTLTSGSILFSGSQPGYLGVTNGANPATLTLGTNVNISGTNGYIGALPGAVSDTIVNRGLIRSDQPGGNITIAPQTFANEGDLEVAGGGTLVIDQTNAPTPWINQGRLAVEPGGLAHLKGAYSTANLGTLDRTGGDMRFTGVLDNTGSTFSISNAQGGLELDAAEIIGGVIDFNDGRQLGLLTSTGDNRLSGVTINGDWTLNSSPWISEGLAVNGTLSLNDHVLFVEGSQTFASGIFDFNNPGSSAFAIRSTGTRPILTLAPGVVVRGGNGVLGSSNSNYDDGLINQGLISSDATDKTISIRTDVFENQGVVEARDGGIMEVGPDESRGRSMPWSNTGILRADGGSLRLGGQATTADLGTIENINGGNVILSGTFDNTNSIFNINSPGGDWWQYGTISGGTVDVASGTLMRLAGNLDGLTLNGDVESQSVTIKNGLTLNGTISLVELSSNITFDGTQTLDGGTIDFGELSGFKQLYMTDNTTLTIGAGTTLLGGSGRIGAGVSTGMKTHLVNEGIIRSDVEGANFSIAPGLFDNYGTVEVVDNATLTIGKSTANPTITNNFGLINVSGGLLDIGGTFSQLNGTLNQTGGQIQLSGTMQNSFSTFTLDGPNAKFNLDGTIVEGTINVLNGAELSVIERDVGILDGVALNGPIEVQGGELIGAALEFVNSVDLNGNVNVSGEIARVSFSNLPTLNSGTITFNGDSTTDQQLLIGTGQNLTLGSGVVIQGGGGLLGKTFNGQPTSLTNQGLIRSDRPGTSLSILSNSFVNTGVVEANTGTSMFVGWGSEIWSNSGTLRANGGRLVLDGAFETSSLSGLENLGGNVWLQGNLDNTGATLTLNSTTGTLELDGGKITGGTIVQTEGAELGLALIPGWGHSLGLLEDVSLVGDLHMPYVKGEWSIFGSFALDGDVVMEGRENKIDFNRLELDNLTIHLNGTGTGSEGNLVTGADFGSGVIARGGRGGIGDIQYNKGLIIADVPNAHLGIGGGDFFVNEGTIEVVPDASLGIFFNSGWSNPGLIRVNEGALSMGGAFSSKIFDNMERIGGDVRIQNADVDNSETEWTLHPGPWTILNGSNIKGGSIIVGPLSSLAIGGGNTTSFENVTIRGDLSMPDEGTTLWIKGDLDLSGTLSMTAPSTNLHFSHEGTLGFGTVFFDGTIPGERKIRAIKDTTFTLGSLAVVHGGSGEIFTGPSSTVINQGLISADMNEQAITITTKRFDNQGTLEAINGGELILIESPEQIGPMPAAFLHNKGILSLGSESGIVIGGFLQEPGGLTSLGISAIGLSTTGSFVDISGTAWLSGAFEVEMVGNPRFGDEFRLFRWSGVNGEFDSLTLPQLSGTLQWDTSSLYRTGVLQVVPTPGSLSLLAGAGVLFAIGRNRRSTRDGEQR